jgi:hypothetical protein
METIQRFGRTFDLFKEIITLDFEKIIKKLEKKKYSYLSPMKIKLEISKENIIKGEMFGYNNINPKTSVRTESYIIFIKKDDNYFFLQEEQGN